MLFGSSSNGKFKVTRLEECIVQHIQAAADIFVVQGASSLGLDPKDPAI